MIHITTWGRWGVTARGHADYAPHGQDIVCAAVSVLLDTYAAAARRYQAEYQLRQAPGRMDILIRTLPPKHRRELDAVRAAVLAGLERVAMAYPGRIYLDDERSNP